MVERSQSRLNISIRQFPLFQGLDNTQIAYLADGATYVDATRGNVLCDNRTHTSGFFGVLDGKLKLALLSRCGREHVLDILDPGMSFWEYTLQTSAPCPLYLEALKRSEVLCLNRERMLSAVDHWPELRLNLVDTLTENLNRLLDNLATCCLQSATQKVAHYLLSLAETADKLNSCSTITLPACKATVACSLDLTPETFSRELHQFERDGLLLINKRNIQIFDRNKLQQFVF
jgi:CRP-like cAMP-binding protein